MSPLRFNTLQPMFKFSPGHVVAFNLFARIKLEYAPARWAFCPGKFILVHVLNDFHNFSCLCAALPPLRYVWHKFTRPIGHSYVFLYARRGAVLCRNSGGSRFIAPSFRPVGGPRCWQRRVESNQYLRFWRPPCYHYTTPFGTGGWSRTSTYGSQSPVPYLLATPA